MFEWWQPLQSYTIAFACIHSASFVHILAVADVVAEGGGSWVSCLTSYLIVFAGRSHMAWLASLTRPHDFVGFLGIHHTTTPPCWLSWHLPHSQTTLLAFVFSVNSPRSSFVGFFISLQCIFVLHTLGVCVRTVAFFVFSCLFMCLLVCNRYAC